MHTKMNNKIENPLKSIKIISTVGPATNTYETLEKLLLNGTNVFRLNFSHRKDSFDVFDEFFDIFKSLRKKYTFGVALDTGGPEIRINGIKNNPTNIYKGQHIRFINKDFCDQNEYEDLQQDDYKIDHIFYFNFANFEDVKTDYLCSVDDGQLKLKVLMKDKCSLTCITLSDHNLFGNKSFNFPGVSYNLPYMNVKDKEDIKYGVLNQVDFIFASFISKINDLESVKNVVTAVINETKLEILERKARKIPQNLANINTYLGDCTKDGAKMRTPLFIAKIESKEGYENIDELIDISDGIMIARGDLGVELSLPEVFIAQKIISLKCVNKNKMFIVATQMMESMVGKSLPTRAEITDVGNAVLDGADCVMTSAETATGKYPVECISMIGKVCKVAYSLVTYFIKAIELDGKFRIIENDESIKIIFSKLKSYDIDQKYKLIRKIYMNKMTKAFIFIGDIQNNLKDLLEIRKYGPIILFTSDVEILSKFNIYKGLVPFRIDATLKVNYENFENAYEFLTLMCKENFKISDTEICFIFSKKDIDNKK